MFTPLKKTRLHERISKQLIDLILSGELKAGDNLPTERDLAQELGVSRTAIREALAHMVEKGYLQTRADGGTVVREIDLETILPYVSGLLSANRNLIGDLLGVRKLLEAEMAADAARAVTPERAARLKSLADQFASDIAEGKTGLSADNRFHGYIAELAQNSAMQLINEMCSDLLSDTRLATLRVPEHREKTVQDHLGIYEAIAAGDAALASQRMREHLTRAHAVLQETDKPEA